MGIRVTVRRVSYSAASCLLIIIAIALMNQNPYNQAQNPPRPYIDSATPMPPFPALRQAYTTDVWKTIDGVNITDVVSKAKSAGFNVTLSEYIWEWAYGKGTIYKLAVINYDHTSMGLYYDRVSDLTHVQFHLSEGGDSTGPLWERLSWYMNVKQDVLRRSMWDFEQQSINIGFVVAGMPDWVNVRTDLGNLTAQEYYLGTVWEKFDRGYIQTATFSEIIQADCVIGSPGTGEASRGILRVEIDGRGNARLDVYESRLLKLSDPGTLFVPIFESLGLPPSALQEFEFNESLWLVEGY